MRTGTTLTAAVLCSTVVLALFSCAGAPSTVIEDSQVRLELTPQGGIAISYKKSGSVAPLSNGTVPAFNLIAADGSLVPLMPVSRRAGQTPPGDPFGPGKTLEAEFAPQEGSGFEGVSLRVNLTLGSRLTGTVIGRAAVFGLTPETMGKLSGTRFYALEARADLADPSAEPYDFRLFRGPAYNQGDWYTRIKLEPGYHAPNSTVFTGRVQPYGGGFPLDYIWTRSGGLALGLADTTARAAALPVKVLDSSAVSLAVERYNEFIHPDDGGTVTDFPVMLGAFGGDYFDALGAYGRVLEAQGFVFAEAPAASYEANWCSWGFDREVTAEDILGNLDAVKHLGMKWVVMDDGYQTGIGAWPLDPKKFPRGDADMRALVDSIHAAGLKAGLWWVPMNVTPDDPLYAEHPDWVVLDHEGNKRLEYWWNCYQLCPAHEPVVEQQLGLVRRFLKDWDFDGFKMDGACLNIAGPCYNPAHNHARPEESIEATAHLFKRIMEEAEAIKPGCLMLLCECGLPPSPFKLAWYNQQVTADPISSEQVRARIKMYRGLMGAKAAPFGDHVELSTGWYQGPEGVRENGHDFASSLALGGVIGSKFTALVDDTTGLDWREFKALRPHWEHWFALYHELELYEGEYLNLYDIAWDTPEAHAVGKGEEVFYGFFHPGFDGRVELRGLKPGVKYALTNYAEGDSPLGEVTGGPGASLDAKFTDHLLVRARTVK